MKKLLSIVLVALMLCSTAVMMSACGESGKTINSEKDLEGAKIGVQLGTTGDELASDVKDAKVERYNKGADAVLALSQGKIDCVIIDSEPAKAFVADNDKLKILDTPFATEEYAICMDKGNDDLLKKFNTALAEIKEEGIDKDIVNNYIGDNIGKTPYKTPEGTKYPNGELHMATNAEFKPYEFYDNGEIVGIDVMMAKAICDKLGYELVIDDMAFKAVINAVKSGKSDFGMAGMTVTEDRLKSVDFTDTYADSTQVIIVRK